MSRELPSVENVLKDPANQNTYKILAFRPLSKQEMLLAIKTAQQNGILKPAKGKTYTITTIVGFDS